MDRQSSPQISSVAVGAATAGPFNAEKFAGGVISPQSGWTAIAAFTFQVCATPDGTFLDLIDDAGVAVSCVVAPGKATPIPPEVLQAPYFKAIGDVVVPAGSAKTVTVMLKS